MSFDQIADKVLAIALRCLLFDRQVRAAIVLAFGLPLAAVLWLTRRSRIAGSQAGTPLARA